jgi:lipopolysaccharide/colanic/teichoic acid biosynthesis glycosyltransferase
MAVGSKIALQNVRRGTEFCSGYIAYRKAFLLLGRLALSALVGLACALLSAITLRAAIQPGQLNLDLIVTALVLILLNALGVEAIFALFPRYSDVNLFVPFTISFLGHFVWFTFADDSNRDLTWRWVPAIYAATLACSVAFDFLHTRPKRVGAIAFLLTPEISERLSNEVELVADPSTDASRYDVLLVDSAAVLSPEWAKYISAAALSGREIRDVRRYVIQQTAALFLEDVEPEALRRELNKHHAYVLIKRYSDIVVTLLMAPIAGFLGGMAALAILISMGRPIIFAQDRVGRHGRVFRMYKLRTMCVQDPNGTQIATSKNDNRITPLGKIFRRYRIDELPQLLNVLKGDMSLIGPRPEQPQLAAEYKQIIPQYDLRHEVNPGLSGWAQVNFGYASTIDETRTKMTYDLYYVREFGPVLDIEIAFATVWTLLSAQSAR